eukprot:scaffold538242_cov51-Prasinocladus_malaysianus.AAC.1
MQTGDNLPTAWNNNASPSPVVELDIGVLSATGCIVTVSHLEIQCVAPEYTGYSSITGLTM